MNCRTARKIIPDFINGVLSEGKKTGVDRHLQNCAECRADADAFRAGLEAMKNPDIAGEMDFTEAEWTAAIRRAVTSRPAETAHPSALMFRPAFGYGLSIILIVAAIVFGARRFPWLVPNVETSPAAVAAKASVQPDVIQPIDPETGLPESNLWARAARAASPSSRSLPASTPTGDVPSFTWISQETGLQIVWFVNDNLEMED